MTSSATSAFDLPVRLAAKTAPALIATDEEHFAAIARCLARSIAELSDRLDAERSARGAVGQEAMDRDLEVHRLTARLRTLRRFGLDLCIGRMTRAGDPRDSTPVYIGRIGLTDDTGRRLLLDWRTPAAEPFFAATHANPMGLASRRRYRWAAGRVSDYWDEVFVADGVDRSAALDDQSAFIASLGTSRSAKMRDVLATIQTDQDAIIRAGSRGALVVEGGPGTGKTVVALHRAAYLLYSDPRVEHDRGGVLFIGPHQPYLAYVADVLPGLGEEGVQLTTLRGLVPQGESVTPEPDPYVAGLKASARIVDAVGPAVDFYEQPPAEGMVVETPWAAIAIRPRDWAEAFESVDPGVAHNDAREQVWDALIAIMLDRLHDALDDGPTDDHDDTVDDGADDQFDAYGRGVADPDAVYRRSLEANAELARAFGRAWPLLEATDLVGDLWTEPAYLRMCAPWLTPDQVRALQRTDPHAWTAADLPLLDAARRRLGDPAAARRRRRREVAAAAERERMSDVVSDLIASDDSDMKVMSMLRGQDLRVALDDDSVMPDAGSDLLAGPFAHIVVDEAQELTDAEWQMLLQRCPSRSFTIVGDRAQARHGFAESWPERLARVGFRRVELAALTVNYRTPKEVMAEAEPVIRAALPDANVPTSIRLDAHPVVHGHASQLLPIVDSWLASHDDGIACVIGDPAFEERSRVRSLAPELSKGLEFDLVVLVDPDRFGDGIEGAVDRYVAMTRATAQLVILRSS